LKKLSFSKYEKIKSFISIDSQVFVKVAWLIWLLVKYGLHIMDKKEKFNQLLQKIELIGTGVFDNKQLSKHELVSLKHYAMELYDLFSALDFENKLIERGNDRIVPPVEPEESTISNPSIETTKIEVPGDSSSEVQPEESTAESPDQHLEFLSETSEKEPIPAAEVQEDTTEDPIENNDQNTKATDTIEVKTSESEKVLSINERLKQERETVADRIKQQQAEDVLGNINLNDRILYVSRLFGGDAEAFSATVHRLQTMPSYEAARNFLIEEVSDQYNWVEEEKVSNQFFDLVMKKFNG
jgi:hypothetical protein